MYIQYFDKKLLLSLVSPRSRASRSLSIFCTNPAVSGIGACSIGFNVITVLNSYRRSTSADVIRPQSSSKGSISTERWLKPMMVGLWSKWIDNASLSCDKIKWHCGEEFYRENEILMQFTINSQPLTKWEKSSWRHHCQQHQPLVYKIHHSWQFQPNLVGLFVSTLFGSSETRRC